MVLDRIKSELPAFAEKLKGEDNFLLLTHRRPDGDTVATAAALCRALRCLGKRAFLCVNPEVTERFKPYYLPYVAPVDFEAETIVTVDISAPQQFENSQRVYLDRIDYVIDHHRANKLEASKSRLIDDKASATGEIMFYLIRELGVEFDSEIAEYLYIAVSTDTGCFKYANTTAETHMIAAECISVGFDLAAVNTEHFEKKTMARSKIERLVYEGLSFRANGRIASIYITQAMRVQTGATDDDVDEFSSIPRQIEGVDAGITVYEQKDGSMKISLRTTACVDASEICAVFGGGGHTRAAGCTVYGTVEEAIDQLAREIERVFERV